MLESWRRKRAIARVKPGDGKPLKPMRAWQSVYRTVFHIDLPDDGTQRTYSVNVPYLDLDTTVSLYRDGRRTARAATPAVLPVPGGVIEVRASTFGLSRMHFVPHDGAPRTLLPDRASAEGIRARFAHRFPRASRAAGTVAIAVLLVGLVVAVPQALEWVTSIDVVAERVGTFTSPIVLPEWASTSLLVAGCLAGFERALTLRNHWLIDIDTWFIG